MGSTAQGLFILLLTGLTFSALLRPEDQGLHARTMTFAILVMCNLGLIFANISDGSLKELRKLLGNPLNLTIVAGVPLLLFAGIQFPVAAQLFNLIPLGLNDILITIGASLVAFFCVAIGHSLTRIGQSRS